MYIEFTNGWSESDCSYWVRENVIPLLGKGERLTRREAGAGIIAWLESFELPATLLGETTWDTGLFADLMHECGIGPDRYRLEALVYSGMNQTNAFAAARKRYFDLHQLTPHHALTDARAFQGAWNSVFGTRLFSR